MSGRVRRQHRRPSERRRKWIAWAAGLRTHLAACLALLFALAAAGPGAAVQPTAAGTLAGRVVDAATGEPVPNAVVTLEGASPGLVADPRGRALLVSARSAVTGGSGTYFFTDVPPGLYRLRVERLGYRGATLEVDVRRPGEGLVSVGLEVEPVALEPMRIVDRAASLFQRAANAAFELDEARVNAERERQSLFLSPDARVLTYADVMDGVTLGEGDVFRAIQRFPGVGTRDDYTAELWTRGAPWTHTRVTFDGIPLYNPVHAVGVLSAITPEVLGAVFFHPGVRPASVPEGAAGVVDLRSRPGGGHGRIRAVADVSMATSKVALDQHIEGRGAWVVSARRSHLDVLAGGLDWLGLDTVGLPFVFHDLAGRVDVELGRIGRLEASGLWEEDRLTGDLAGVLERTQARWGNRAGRMTWSVPAAGLEWRHTLSGTRFSARTDPHVVRTRAEIPEWRRPGSGAGTGAAPGGGMPPAPGTTELAWVEPASRNEVRYVQVAGEAAPFAADPHAPWSVGYDVARSHGRYEGPLPRYHAVKPDTSGTLRLDRTIVVAALWGEARVRLLERLEVQPGLRVESGSRIRTVPSVRFSPRLAARLTVSPDQTVSVAAGRSWQYAQAMALAGPSLHPAFHASHFWVFAGDAWAGMEAPALRTDIVSAGSERWLGGGWLGTGTVYVRRATGVTVPDPAPGRLRGRPIFVVGENVARGADIGLRRIGARWSASVGYGYGVSEIEAAGHRFPGPSDRRHIADVMVGARLAPPVRVSMAYSAMSGAPFTRAYPLSPQECSAFGFGCDSADGAYVQAANAERTPRYASLDASLQWTGGIGPVEVTGYVQVRNVLGRDNASTYAGSLIAGREVTDVMGRDPEVRYLWDDRFEPGLPRLPLVGVRATF